uniref:Putative ovule protein n=1 Tax=Solanum chacoense TaxID=4108 RepID=A0A0V0HLL6_SOLCH
MLTKENWFQKLNSCHIKIDEQRFEVGVASALFHLTLLGSTLAQKRASTIIPSHFHFSTCRYFYTLENSRRTCYNCDEDGCAAFHCTSTKRN